ncbi:hypothetical protein NEOLI_000448 [Neolecta irregularis DAH-3]|uniref:Uncharacterized protein n=1 Tax=Neolecta irregularis (strain DAH-3) TaxID=1198029 RepID=A0A1U7LGR1_NEOID|nr:hypothetical protein NEOLI_000448 [Neolecta irregularis DAH-3]|eukprot:OLL21845.1 hypothetical protein NEOLI_000448 [Neolecta irregularis DAH-3]
MTDSGVLLDELRRQSRVRLETAWHDIFEKYGRDLEDISDVIDLDTGEIIEDHGHLRMMKRQDMGSEADIWALEENPDGTDEELQLRDPNPWVEPADGNESDCSFDEILATASIKRSISDPIRLPSKADVVKLFGERGPSLFKLFEAQSIKSSPLPSYNDQCVTYGFSDPSSPLVVPVYRNPRGNIPLSPPTSSHRDLAGLQSRSLPVSALTVPTAPESKPKEDAIWLPKPPNCPCTPSTITRRSPKRKSSNSSPRKSDIPRPVSIQLTPTKRPILRLRGISSIKKRPKSIEKRRHSGLLTFIESEKVPVSSLFTEEDRPFKKSKSKALAEPRASSVFIIPWKVNL